MLLVQFQAAGTDYENNYYFETGDHKCISYEFCILMKKELVNVNKYVFTKLY